MIGGEFSSFKMAKTLAWTGVGSRHDLKGGFANGEVMIGLPEFYGG